MPRDTYPPEVKTEEVLETWRLVLLEAAEIVRRGWCRGSLGNPGGPRCAIGAIGQAAETPFGGSYQERFHNAVIAVARHLLPTYRVNEHVGMVVCWNDRECQTAENVASTMERVALEGLSR